MKKENIRNFCIIAHIDHGKSTLADRMMEHTNLLSLREMREQFLDDMDLEREKGITIKAKAVRLMYEDKSTGEEYQLNMIDTPGHVDFSYEVSKSLSACEGALLVIDASQGIEAQTVANVHLAFEKNLEMIPVLNKIDLPNADPEVVIDQLEDVLAVEKEKAVLVSAKSGQGIEEVLQSIVKYIPAPEAYDDKPLQALIFDAVYDNYRGVIVYVRLTNGVIKKGMKLLLMGMGTEYEVIEVGIFAPTGKAVDELRSGEVGYVIANIKGLSDVRVGDTITDSKKPAEKALSGYKEVKSMVFAGIYPINSGEYDLLREALNKLELNDSSLTYEPEVSAAVGFGFRCGFLGLLHMEIIQERIEREYAVDVIMTVPNVEYRAHLLDGSVKIIDNPSDMPDSNLIEKITEPLVKAIIIVPSEYIGSVMQLCQDRRGVYERTDYLNAERAILKYDMPLSEIVIDFYDKLKTITRGYASFDYEIFKYKEAKLVKLDILINDKIVDPLSIIVERSNSEFRGRKLIDKLRELIPRQLFDVVIQSGIGSKIIARTQVKAYKKNVTEKCYGGDITRKRKLIEKQKQGKKRMKQIGNVQVPQEAFLAVLKMDE
jgi:GTP-binding protein LepA